MSYVNKSLRVALQAIRDEATKPLDVEMERLRAALQKIADRFPSGYHDPGDYERGYGQACHELATIARNALAQGGSQ